MPSPQRRRGTFVTGQLGARRRLRVQTTLDDLVAMYSGDRPDHATLSVGVVAPVLSESDGQKAPKYYYLRRVHSRDGERYGVISIYIDHRVFRRAPARFRRELALPVLIALPGLRSQVRARRSPSQPPMWKPQGCSGSRSMHPVATTST